MRAHLLRSVLDTQGNLLAGTAVAVYQNGTIGSGTPVLFSDPIYPDGESASLLTNPYITPDGNVDFYLDVPQRVDLGITPPGQSMVPVPDVDVLVASTESLSLTFPGSASGSTQVGASASATQAQAVAFGDSAVAEGPQATAAGQAALASGTGASAYGQNAQAAGTGGTAAGASSSAPATQATALGTDTLASGSQSLAAGVNAVATGSSASAIGADSTASNLNSTAVGTGSATTEDDQIMLGSPTGVVDVPGQFTRLSTPGNIKWRLYVTDAGVLYTRYHFPVDAVNLLTGNDTLTVSGSIGSWVSGLAVTVAPSTAFINTGTGSMLITQTGAGPAYATSLAVAVNVGTWYVGKAWMYRHAGDGAATQFQAWLAFYNSINALIGSALLGPPQTIVNDNWTVADVRAQAPSGAVTAKLQIGVPSGGATGDKLYAATTGIFAVPQVA